MESGNKKGRKRRDLFLQEKRIHLLEEKLDITLMCWMSLKSCLTWKEAGVP